MDGIGMGSVVTDDTSGMKMGAMDCSFSNKLSPRITWMVGAVLVESRRMVWVAWVDYMDRALVGRTGLDAGMACCSMVK